MLVKFFTWYNLWSPIRSGWLAGHYNDGAGNASIRHCYYEAPPTQGGFVVYWVYVHVDPQ